MNPQSTKCAKAPNDDMRKNQPQRTLHSGAGVPACDSLWLLRPPHCCEPLSLSLTEYRILLHYVGATHASPNGPAQWPRFTTDVVGRRMRRPYKTDTPTGSLCYAGRPYRSTPYHPLLNINISRTAVIVAQASLPAIPFGCSAHPTVVNLCPYLKTPIWARLQLIFRDLTPCPSKIYLTTLVVPCYKNMNPKSACIAAHCAADKKTDNILTRRPTGKG